MEEKDVLQRAALILRRDVLNIRKEELSEKVTSCDVIKGECTIPQTLENFYLTLIAGIDRRRRNNIRRIRKVCSLSEDVIYVITNGQIKTSKHMTLGIALKSLTSSRKVVDILNKYGHCCSYNVVDEL